MAKVRQIFINKLSHSGGMKGNGFPAQIQQLLPCEGSFGLGLKHKPHVAYLVFNFNQQLDYNGRRQ